VATKILPVRASDDPHVRVLRAGIRYMGPRYGSASRRSTSAMSAQSSIGLSHAVACGGEDWDVESGRVTCTAAPHLRDEDDTLFHLFPVRCLVLCVYIVLKSWSWTNLGNGASAMAAMFCRRVYLSTETVLGAYLLDHTQTQSFADAEFR
jgi:hypothetical protein